jgi:hypothetical protein
LIDPDLIKEVNVTCDDEITKDPRILEILEEIREEE